MNVKQISAFLLLLMAFCSGGCEFHPVNRIWLDFPKDALLADGMGSPKDPELHEALNVVHDLLQDNGFVLQHSTWELVTPAPFAPYWYYTERNTRSSASTEAGEKTPWTCALFFSSGWNELQIATKTSFHWDEQNHQARELCRQLQSRLIEKFGKDRVHLALE